MLVTSLKLLCYQNHWQHRPQPCNMAATGKKSKKTKWVKASVTNFIADTTVIPATNNWADSVDEETSTYSSYASSRPRPPVVLPSASRAARGDLGVDDESIPRRPPYIAHISNLPYDVDESAIMELFAGLKINNLRLPREGERLKGFGNVEFEDRESLVSAMNMPDLTVGGRRIRIEVSNQDNDRRMGRNNRGDRDREYDPERTMGDWRSGPRAVPDSSSRARPMERDGMRDRDRDRERESSTDNKPGAWRDAERAEPPRAPYGGRDSYGRDRERERGYGGRDGFRTAERDGGGFGGRESRGFGSRGFGDRDRDPPREDSKPRERPKLNLLPRTVPREVETPTKPADGAPIEKIDSKPAPKPVSAEKVFGAAKPVDTAAKEREIEERLRKQEEENRRAAEEKERWSRRNDHSDDRRSGARRDDRDRGYRSNYKDRRDYSRDDKDKRDYSKEDRDRNSSRDSRDRRESHDREEGDRRDNSRRRDDDDDRRDNHDRDERPESRDRERDRRSPSPKKEQNGRESRSRDRRDVDERPLPKLKEQEKPNFVASNKFSFLDADDVSE
ncbi:eukaryotic translation initiation factor 4B isoform X2 [Aricia agestis]|uniref:eukaryotic translation initiation factor 4B isoform X2 n=1 Tax=Aricia agestis TaxID=91739 RepID=UPI001C20BB62|nr:eukaryotic translation initiation factor 4B isoform X2 [Aricia agestis]